ncbi:MAG TPA: hypothetical protein PKY95_10605, partial [candidate division Zixibacteria bacterium]|nr:hypothetical protein [candidate division Zixibacteria bacterium]
GPALGWIVDRFGAQVMIRAGILMFGLGFLLLSQIDSLGMFYAAIVVMAIPFVLLAMSSSAGLIAALAIGIPLFWLVSLPAGGFLGAVFETMYTLFYFRLLEPIPAGAPATA